MGFGFTDEDDRLWAQGWPFMIHLVPGEPTAKDKPYAHMGEMKRAVADTIPPRTEVELFEATRRVIASHSGMHDIFLLEAKMSSAWVLEHVVDALEALTPAQWKSLQIETNAGNTFRALHFVMLRGDHEGHARERLRKLATKAPADPMHRGAEMLRFILDPKPAKTDSWQLTYLAEKDADAIADALLPQLAKAKPADRFHVDARMIYLGGDRVMAGVAKHIKNLHKGHQETLVEHLSRSAHPAVADAMRAVNNGPAKKWLKAHA